MSKRIIDQVKKVSHFVKVDIKRVKRLQKILNEHHNRNVPLKEAEEVARELIGLYECLADGRNINSHRREKDDDE